MKLRKATNAGMMDCKHALQEAEGDFDKAVDIIRKKGLVVNRSLVSKLAGLLWRTTRQLIKFKNVNFKEDTKCQIQISTNY